ncbi:MAG: Fic family protein [Akkermansia sp.]|nr:Fic family protein [Akkermansia sp.]
MVKLCTDMWSEFGEYTPDTEPEGAQRLYVWQMAVGLQAVDGLKPSDFLLQTARRNIAGDIGIDEARRLVYEYYDKRELRTAQERAENEADKVSANIAKLLGERSFKLFPGIIRGIHQRLFEGVYSFAGEYRKVDISKKEWVLRGDSVLYCIAPMIAESVNWDIEQELKRDYIACSMPQAVEQIAKFIAGLWQIHPFREGNTRTMAVFLIKYLRYMGFEVDNTPFARHSRYFCNALVRANYSDKQREIHKDYTYLVSSRIWRTPTALPSWFGKGAATPGCRCALPRHGYTLAMTRIPARPWWCGGQSIRAWASLAKSCTFISSCKRTTTRARPPP